MSRWGRVKLCIFLPSKLYKKFLLSQPKNKLPRDISNENYKKNIWGYSPFCSYLITKESYNWWITRRKWGFRHQISEANNLKMSVTNIWKHTGAFRRSARWLRNFTGVQDGCKISQPKVDFAACEIDIQLDVIGFQWI